MDRDNVKKLLSLMTLQFSNFKLDNPAATVDAWLMFLQDYSDEDVMMAYKTYVNTNTSGFAPAISQLIGLINKPADLACLSVSEAWAKVRVAIGRSGYNSVDEFNKLDPLTQKAVGNAEQLHYWAIDENYNDEVVMSIFSRNYQAILKKDSEERRLPTEAKARLEQIRRDNIALLDTNKYLIGHKVDKLQEGDFNYEEPQRPDNETLGHYAQQLREKLGVE